MNGGLDLILSLFNSRDFIGIGFCWPHAHSCTSEHSMIALPYRAMVYQNQEASCQNQPFIWLRYAGKVYLFSGYWKNLRRHWGQAPTAKCTIWWRHDGVIKVLYFKWIVQNLRSVFAMDDLELRNLMRKTSFFCEYVVFVSTNYFITTMNKFFKHSLKGDNQVQI